MRMLALAAVAATLVSGAALAQDGQSAGGPLGDYSRRTGQDPWGTTYGPPGVLVSPGIVVDGPATTGTIITREPVAPGYEVERRPVVPYR